MRGDFKMLALTAITVVLVATALIFEFLFPASPLSDLIRLVNASYVGAALRLTVPIAFAALGGIFAEKSGVINIGLEGLLIIAAFTSVMVAHSIAPESTGAQWLGAGVMVVLVAAVVLLLWAIDAVPGGRRSLGMALLYGAGGTAVLVAVFVLFGGNRAGVWLGFLYGIYLSTLFALLFAIITIRYRADQIIAGLAVWLIALGLAPFASRIIWGTINSPSVNTLDRWNFAEFLAAVPLVGEPIVAGMTALPSVFGIIPVVGPDVASFLDGAFDFIFLVLFDAIPTVYMLLVAAPLSWYVINHTTFGRWVRASGENPKALDTAGVNVTRVRYSAVILSGILSGIGGAGLALGQVGQFIGSGQTMVNGRGWIGITAYLFGNYNPLGAFGAGFLFASLDALQIRVQQVTFVNLPPPLVRIVPFVTVIVVLALVGKTRIPDAAGDHYDPGED